MHVLHIHNHTYTHKHTHTHTHTHTVTFNIFFPLSFTLSLHPEINQCLFIHMFIMLALGCSYLNSNVHYFPHLNNPKHRCHGKKYKGAEGYNLAPQKSQTETSPQNE